MTASPNERPAPSIGIRLLWWFGIYFAAQLPLIPCIYAWVHGWNPWIWVLFPQGLAWGLFMLTGRLLDRIHQISNAASIYFSIALLALPWALYAVHLIYSLRVERRPTFVILMWILGAIVLINLGSCADFLCNPPE